MAEDMSKAVKNAIEQQQRVRNDENLRRSVEMERAQKEKRLAALTLPRSGVKICELEGLVDVEARYLLAGFVSSAIATRIPTETFDRKGSGRRDAITYLTSLAAGKIINAWKIQTGVSIGRAMDTEYDVKNFSLLTPDYRLRSQYSYTGTKEILTHYVRGSVIASLAEREASWVEPDPATYR